MILLISVSFMLGYVFSSTGRKEGRTDHIDFSLSPVKDYD